MSGMLYHYMILFIVLLGLVLVTAILKKYMVKPIGKTNQLRIVGQIPVGTKERVALLEYEGMQIVVGITAHNISTLYVKTDSKDV